MTETDQKKVDDGQALSFMRDTGGYGLLYSEINRRIKEGWEEFIKLSAEKKTSKLAQHYQAQYLVLKEILEFVEDGIKEGEQIDRSDRRRNFTPQPVRAGE